MLKILLTLSCTLCHYFSPKYDPLLRDGSMDEVTGFLENHYLNVPGVKFGNLALMTLNAEYGSDLELPAFKEQILDLLTTAHPTILSLQEVAPSILQTIPERLGTHYLIANTEKGIVDLLTSGIRYLPILYDAVVVKHDKSGFFEGSGSTEGVYAAWSKFTHLETKKQFTVINVNLYSAFKDVTEAEMANIINDIQTDAGTASHPVFVTGTINSVSDELRELFGNVLANMLNLDPNNQGLPRATLQLVSDYIHDTERDYLLRRDPNKELVVHLARILTKVPYGGAHHYPVYGIVTLKK